MSHLRPEDRTARASRTLCRRGRHYFGAWHDVGGGIQRRVCESCGEVTIDLTVAENPVDGAIPVTTNVRTRPGQGS